MIGNRGYAMYIREWAREKQRADNLGSYQLPREAPDGWKYIGQGCYRAAYLSPDGVIYKIQVTPGRFCGQSNADEHKRWWQLRIKHREIEGMRWPLMNLFRFEEGDDINAMDYVGPTLSSYYGPDYRKYVELRTRCAWHLGLSDSHNGNFAIDEKLALLVPIDLGM